MFQILVLLLRLFDHCLLFQSKLFVNIKSNIVFSKSKHPLELKAPSLELEFQ
jgi:hypothetical protein